MVTHDRNTRLDNSNFKESLAANHIPKKLSFTDQPMPSWGPMTKSREMIHTLIDFDGKLAQRLDLRWATEIDSKDASPETHSSQSHP